MNDIKERLREQAHQEFEKFAKTKRAEYFKRLDPTIKQIVDYYKPAMWHGNLVDLKAMNSGKGWNHDMTILFIDVQTYNTFKKDKQLADPNKDLEETFTSGPQLIEYVFGTYDSTYETMYQISYERIYEELDRLGYVDAYHKMKRGK